LERRHTNVTEMFCDINAAGGIDDVVHIADGGIKEKGQDNIVAPAKENVALKSKLTHPTLIVRDLPTQVRPVNIAASAISILRLLV